jgi:hypothetical protein
LNRIKRNFYSLAEEMQADINSNSALSKSQKLALESELLNFTHVSERAEEGSKRLAAKKKD